MAKRKASKKRPVKIKVSFLDKNYGSNPHVNVGEQPKQRPVYHNRHTGQRAFNGIRN